MDSLDKRLSFFKSHIKKKLDSIRGDIGELRYKLYIATVNECDDYLELREMAELEMQIDMIEYTNNEINHKLKELNTDIKKVIKEDVQNSCTGTNKKASNDLINENISLLEDIDDPEMQDVMANIIYQKLMQTDYAEESTEEELIDDDFEDFEFDEEEDTEEEEDNDFEDFEFDEEEDTEEEDNDFEDFEFDEEEDTEEELLEDDFEDFEFEDDDDFEQDDDFEDFEFDEEETPESKSEGLKDKGLIEIDDENDETDEFDFDDADFGDFDDETDEFDFDDADFGDFDDETDETDEFDFDDADFGDFDDENNEDTSESTDSFEFDEDDFGDFEGETEEDTTNEEDDFEFDEDDFGDFDVDDEKDNNNIDEEDDFEFDEDDFGDFDDDIIDINEIATDKGIKETNKENAKKSKLVDDSTEAIKRRRGNDSIFKNGTDRGNKTQNMYDALRMLGNKGNKVVSKIDGKAKQVAKRTIKEAGKITADKMFELPDDEDDIIDF